MKSFIRWLNENYAPRSSNWLYLRNYLRDAENKFDVLDNWTEFKNWDKSEEIASVLGLDLEDDENISSNSEKINSYLLSNRDLLDEFIYEYLQGEEAPAYTSMSHERDLPPSTWLVHFSDDADSISKVGFKYGASDIRTMHYTRGETYKSRTSEPGYNFAFLANSKDAYSAAKDSKYGSDAVMFMSAGVLSYHAGDNENQVVFDGENVRPSDIVFLYKDSYDWVVKSKNPNVRDPFRSDDFSKVVKWVMNNWQQYKKVLMV